MAAPRPTSPEIPRRDGPLAVSAGLVCALILGGLALMQPLPPVSPSPAAADSEPMGEARDLAPCVMDREGFLRAQLRGGALLDIDWRGTRLGCAGDEHPTQRRTRLYFAGPMDSEHRLLLVLGIEASAAQLAGREHPVSVTLIDEASDQFFHSGTGRCFTRIDEVAPLAETPVGLRVTGELYCATALAAVTGLASVTIGELHFSGRLTQEARHP